MLESITKSVTIDENGNAFITQGAAALLLGIDRSAITKTLSKVNSFSECHTFIGAGNATNGKQPSISAKPLN